MDFFFPLWLKLTPEPTSVELHVDGVTDICTKEEDINFIFTGFSVSGTVRNLFNTEIRKNVGQAAESFSSCKTFDPNQLNHTDKTLNS